MFAQKLQRVFARGGVVLLIRKCSRLARCILLHAQAPIDDGENVMRGEVVRIYRLNILVLRARLIVFVHLIKRESKFAMSIARTRVLRCHLAQIGNCCSRMSLNSLYKREIDRKSTRLNSS